MAEYKTPTSTYRRLDLTEEQKLKLEYMFGRSLVNHLTNLGKSAPNKEASKRIPQTDISEDYDEKISRLKGYTGNKQISYAKIGANLSWLIRKYGSRLEPLLNLIEYIREKYPKPVLYQ